MGKKKGLSRTPLKERGQRETEKARRKMLGSQYIRRTFLMLPDDDGILEDLVRKIRNETEIEVTKSNLVRRAIRRIKDLEVKDILGIHEVNTE